MAAELTLYCDTSALLKLYLEEAESPRLREICGKAVVSCTHLIAYAEMRAGLARAARMRRIDTSALNHQVGRFEADWAILHVVTPDETQVRRAGDLAQRFDLRGYDSVHLAAAEAIWRAAPELDFRFAAFDTRLVEAARDLGMRGLG